MSRLARTLALAPIVALSLAGCVPNTTATGSGSAAALTVAMTDTTCQVSAHEAESGTTSFTISNTGTDVNEFEILADDKLRIVGEKENVTPGQTVTMVQQLQPGTYYTACKFRLVGDPIDLTEFTVTGEEVAASSDQEALDAAAVLYLSYVKSQVDELVPAVTTFVNAYIDGDTAKAKSLFSAARVSYERVEPTAEQFGDLDPKIDYRKPGADAEGLDWTGFHRIEADLWFDEAGKNYPDGSIKKLSSAERKTVGTQLITDVTDLSSKVNATDFTLSISDITNGAVGLLDEVAAPDGKLSGEEDEFSHTDLSDFYANVEGADVAYGTVRDIALSKGTEGKELVDELDTQFAAMKKLLSTYGSYADGFDSYDTVSQDKRNALAAQLNALSEPLSKLAHTVLELPTAN